MEHTAYARSFSDSKLPLAEYQLQEEIREMEKSTVQSENLAGNKRDSRTGEELDTSSKRSSESPDKYTVRSLIDNTYCGSLYKISSVYRYGAPEIRNYVCTGLLVIS